MVFFEFLGWVYSEGLGEFTKAWANLHWFFYHFFSVPVLLRTLFWPLKGLGESPGRGFDPAKILESFILNTVMRVVGFFARIILLILAAISQVLILGLGAFGLVLFLGGPFLAAACVVFGFTMIFS